MPSLREFLLSKDYCRIRLFPTVTNHLEMKAKINGVEGSFILDTGASSSCIDFSYAEKFNLRSEDSEVLAAGAGATDMITKLSRKNSIQIQKWKYHRLDIVLFDLTHVNTALENHNVAQVHGILGADLLNQGKGIIDYQYNCLYLK
ncbi:retropepsin-like aspartic protease [Dokdonia sp. Hel_I_53]|uniref:retropepsin-like aspartic protease n=1 Tax=Dokdonia sp. Hel_I_53 TaxID=1566287 RepID=UPI00119B7422|nr:retropepsin-like aspartic protease [Dokdonia sp. Hel_I_53]TVZ52118.1 aspartyl protease [Dokdonia sp. Hel_I_53]